MAPGHDLSPSDGGSLAAVEGWYWPVSAQREWAPWAPTSRSGLFRIQGVRWEQGRQREERCWRRAAPAPALLWQLLGLKGQGARPELARP